MCTVKAEIPLATKLDLSLKNIEEFVPDDYLDKSFLEDSSHQVTIHKPSPGNDSDRFVFGKKIEKFLCKCSCSAELTKNENMFSEIENLE